MRIFVMKYLLICGINEIHVNTKFSISIFIFPDHPGNILKTVILQVSFPVVQAKFLLFRVKISILQYSQPHK